MNFIHNSRRQGAVSFTLLMFMLLIASVALMYYYFMRTRQLQAELNELKQTYRPIAVETAGPIESVKTPAPDNSMGTAVGNIRTAMEQETRRPVATEPEERPAALDLQPVAELESMQPGTDQPVENTPAPDTTEENESEQSEVAETDQIEADEDEISASPTPEATRAPDRPIQSMYDLEPPPMRIRTPRPANER